MHKYVIFFKPRQQNVKYVITSIRMSSNCWLQRYKYQWCSIACIKHWNRNLFEKLSIAINVSCERVTVRFFNTILQEQGRWVNILVINFLLVRSDTFGGNYVIIIPFWYITWLNEIFFLYFVSFSEKSFGKILKLIEIQKLFAPMLY